jgi:hypothetical protein
MPVAFSHYRSVYLGQLALRFENFGQLALRFEFFGSVLSLCIFVRKRTWCKKDVSKCQDHERDLISHIGVMSP